VLDPEDDVARVKWGGNWRIPTDEEWTVLREGCIWEWTTYQGINGCEVYCFESGNSLFLPATGFREHTNFGRVGSRGYYWSSSFDTVHTDYAREVRFDSVNVEGISYYRYYGLSVRPVCD
jgi:hypothetical protein